MIESVMVETTPAPYPIVLRLQGLRCAVFGSGHEAALKSAALEQAGAIVVRSADYDPALIDGASLVIAAGPGREENPRIFADCTARGIFVNCLDDPPNCRFTFPSVHRQGDLTIAVSTNGACPALAVRIRETLGRAYGPEYSAFLEMCRALRDRLKRVAPEFERRKAFWYRLVDSPALGLLREGKRFEAEAVKESLLSQVVEESGHS